MRRLQGVGGNLFPGHFLSTGLAEDCQRLARELPLSTRRRHLVRWWATVEQTCGPATGLRGLFDNVVVPLARRLGFRIGRASFGDRRAIGHLDVPSGGVVGLLLLPWSGQPSTAWRDAVAAARTAGADWCLVAAPPTFSLVDARGHATRRGLDFRLPEALDADSFARLWLLGRAQAFTPAGRATASGSPLIEQLVARAHQFQDEVRSDLQAGVVDALVSLATIRHGRRRASTADRFDEALTLIYRVLFLLFAESRHLVPSTHPIYARAYTVTSLCRDALTSRSVGVWDGLAAITRLSRAGCRTDDLIVRPFNGRLFARASAPALESSGRRRPGRVATARDEALGRALVSLATRRGQAGREAIQYADLGVEQLGAVYERVLDIEPSRSIETSRASSTTRHSARRKETGTFYTPQPLAEFVVRRTLEPLIASRSSEAILELRVVDPAMGSGAFLVAACRFLADAYERALIDEGRLSETDLSDEQRAECRRLVAERCLAGVDINPVAVQLARLSLWLATLARGKPLTFLDHRLRVGNSLAGTTPADLWRTPWLGRRGTPRLPLLDGGQLESAMATVARPLTSMIRRRDDSVREVRLKEAAWAAIRAEQSPLAKWRLACDLWCAPLLADPEHAKVLGKGVPAAIDSVLSADRTLPPSQLAALLHSTRVVAETHRLFHWPLEFVDVFHDTDGRVRTAPGFDAVIGNPPWEVLRQRGASRADGAAAPVARQRLHQFIRRSGVYSAGGRGHVNLYQPFVERSLELTRPNGRIGLVLPWGLASDDGAEALRARLLDEHGVDTVVGLDNHRGIFPIHRGLRFLVVTAGVGRRRRETRARFGVQSLAELDALPGRDDPLDSAYPVRLTAPVLRSVGGSARRIPDVRRASDLRLAERLMSTLPGLGDPEGWHLHFGRELNATDDRESFGSRGLPVVDGKHLAPFTVDVARAVRRITRQEADRVLPAGRHRRARLAYRDVSGVGNRLTLIAAVVPADVVTTHTVFCVREPLSSMQQHFLCGLFNSVVLNALTRLVMGGHVTTGVVAMLPAPVWSNSAAQRRVAYLASRLQGNPGSGVLAARLQAAAARAYGLTEVELVELLTSAPGFTAVDRRRVVSAFARNAL